jgi:hypothetical protein
MNKVVNKHQRGYVYLRSGTFYVRYRGPKIIEGKLAWKQLSYPLCDKSDKSLLAQVRCCPAEVRRIHARREYCGP